MTSVLSSWSTVSASPSPASTLLAAAGWRPTHRIRQPARPGRDDPRHRSPLRLRDGRMPPRQSVTPETNHEQPSRHRTTAGQASPRPHTPDGPAPTRSHPRGLRPCKSHQRRKSLRTDTGSRKPTARPPAPLRSRGLRRKDKPLPATPRLTAAMARRRLTKILVGQDAHETFGVPTADSKTN